MAFNVRLFLFTGVRQTQVLIPQQHQTDAVYRFAWPYVFTALGVSNGGTPVVLGPNTNNPDNATVARLEIPDGQGIRYELNSPQRNVPAGNSSPSLTGINTIDWGQGWFLSFVDLVNFP